MSPTTLSQLAISPKKTPHAAPRKRPSKICPDKPHRGFLVDFLAVFPLLTVIFLLQFDSVVSSKDKAMFPHVQLRT